MIDNKQGMYIQVGYNHLISNKCEWNNIVLLKTLKKYNLLDLADFVLQEQTEDNLMASISQTWYNSS